MSISTFPTRGAPRLLTWLTGVISRNLVYSVYSDDDEFYNINTPTFTTTDVPILSVASINVCMSCIETKTKPATPNLLSLRESVVGIRTQWSATKVARQSALCSHSSLRRSSRQFRLPVLAWEHGAASRASMNQQIRATPHAHDVTTWTILRTEAPRKPDTAAMMVTRKKTPEEHHVNPWVLFQLCPSEGWSLLRPSVSATPEACCPKCEGVGCPTKMWRPTQMPLLAPCRHDATNPALRLQKRLWIHSPRSRTSIIIRTSRIIFATQAGTFSSPLRAQPRMQAC